MELYNLWAQLKTNTLCMDWNSMYCEGLHLTIIARQYLSVRVDSVVTNYHCHILLSTRSRCLDHVSDIVGIQKLLFSLTITPAAEGFAAGVPV